MDQLLNRHAQGAEMKSLLHITKITINRLMLCGFANHATSNGTKRFC